MGYWLDVGLNVGGQGGALFVSGDGKSAYRTGIGDLIRDEQSFRFGGMHGEFLELHGVVGRPITWKGLLRVSEAGLAVIQSQRDQFRMLDGTFTFIDDDNAEYKNCSLRAFEIKDKQRIQVPGAPLLAWRLPYLIILQQQEP
ncbi:MAG TPA: hypothetical protein VMY42_20615 [Thermoguttaceae bacterium]|nr:hypothetical protein [Thermoguttaceae bacterium]